MSQEYAELGANMRHYSELRLTRFTVFLAATGGWLVAYFQVEQYPVPSFAVAVLGLLLTVCFWELVNDLHGSYWSCRRRAVELEGELGFEQYGALPARRRSDLLIGLVFTAVLAVWLVVVFELVARWWWR